MNERIIKAGNAAAGHPSSLPAARVVKGEAYDATMQAAQIVDDARAQARTILESAGQERQTAIEAARAAAYEHGLQRWNAAVADANAARDRHLAESEPELIRLAVRVAEKIIGEELRSNPEAILSVARECMRGAGRERSLTLRVPPADIDLVRRRIGLLRDASGSYALPFYGCIGLELVAAVLIMFRGRARTLS